MPLDPRIQVFLEQAGLMAQAGSVPREPMVLLAELRANDERAKAIVALASEPEPIAHVENRVIPGPAGDIQFGSIRRKAQARSRSCCSFTVAGSRAIWTPTRSCAGVYVVRQPRLGDDEGRLPGAVCRLPPALRTQIPCRAGRLLRRHLLDGRSCCAVPGRSRTDRGGRR